MKRIQVIQFVVTLAVGAIAIPQVRGQTSGSSPAASGLEPMAFLIAHEWDAKLPDSPEGKKRKIHARFGWTSNHRAIRISNELITDGKASPYIEGLYAWDPQQRAIMFLYVGAEGSLTKGVVRMKNGKLVHEFQETRPDGQTADYLAEVTPHGNEAWDNEIFAARGHTAIAKVRYEIAK